MRKIFEKGYLESVLSARLKSKIELNTSLEKIHNQLQTIPLFIKTNDNEIYLLPEIESKNISTKNSILVYMGNKIEIYNSN